MNFELKYKNVNGQANQTLQQQQQHKSLYIYINGSNIL